MPKTQYRGGGAMADISNPEKGHLLILKNVLAGAVSARLSEDDLVSQMQQVVGGHALKEPLSEPTIPYSEASLPLTPTLAAVHPIDTWVQATRSTRMQASPPRSGTSLWSLLPWITGAGVVVAALLYVSQYGLTLKHRATEQGGAAIGHLVDAKGNLERMDWSSAQSDFASAHDQFAAAQDSLELFGPTLTGLLAKMPGMGTLQSGRDLTQAGLAIADAGQAISQVLVQVGQAGSILDTSNAGTNALAQLLTSLTTALDRADADVQQASLLLSGIDTDTLPEQTRAQYNEFKGRLPQIQSLIGEGKATALFASRLLGVDRPRRYLVLFQNSGELRPTGGFPGSYGVVTFEGGKMKNFGADDIYNPDGQIRELVVPPLQLQHITPSWGMRDANWFIDFPLSARKVMAFYAKGGGAAVDGVMTMRPEVLEHLLRLTGPIDMPAYGVTLTADNVIASLQLQVERQPLAPEPKKIIMDLAPLLIERLALAPPTQWLAIMDVVHQSLVARDIMMYAQDEQVQSYLARHNWDGHVVQTAGDYLMVDVSNIKGAKGDAVTDTALKLESRLESGTLVHRLTLTRRHDGGRTPFGFYNKTNYSYVRVLVPQGSTLRGVTGNDHVTHAPLMNYAQSDAVRDADLSALESTYQYDSGRATTTASEAGKTEFGFWMSVQPGQVTQVQLEYVVPAGVVADAYQLHVQRQSGLDISNFEFTIQKDGLTGVGQSTPSLTAWPDSWRLNDSLATDLELVIPLER